MGNSALADQMRADAATLNRAAEILDSDCSAAVSKPTRRRGRRKMTAAERKAVSVRMKKTWAERKKKTRRG